jgi:hypothetical protein
MLANVSMLKSYLACPQIAYNQYIAKRGPGSVSPKLEVGTLFHEYMERKLTPPPQNGDVPEHVPSWFEVSGEARELWLKHQMWLAVDAWEVPDDWQVLGTEVALQNHMLQGRLDAPIIWQNKLWSGQWKSYEDDLMSLQERVRLSWHEVAYQWLAEETCEKLGVRWGGTILGACQKLPSYRVVSGKRVPITDEQRENALTFHYLVRSPAVQERMLSDLIYHVLQMNREVVMGARIARNYDSCFGAFGRGRCPYYSACHEGADIYAPPFVQVEDRY